MLHIIVTKPTKTYILRYIHYTIVDFSTIYTIDQ